MLVKVSPRVRAVAALTLVAGLALAACVSTGTDPAEVGEGVVIRHVTVVNTRDGSLSVPTTVILSQGKIQRLTSAHAIRTSGSAITIDATGKYLVPGYLDMHTHALPLADKQPSPWPLMIAHGITGIREMGGSVALIKRAQQLNADRAAGKMLAPEILQIPGDIFFGAINAPTPAAQAVQQQKLAGADFIKITNSNREVTLAILAEAKKQGLDVAGHLPPVLSASEASKAGWRAIEHLGAGMGVLLDCANDALAVRQALASGQGARPPFPPTFILTPMLYRAVEAPLYQRIIDSYDEAKCQATARVMTEHETWQVPTLIRVRTMMHSDDALYRNDPNLIYADKATRALWESLAQQYAANVPAAAAATFRQFYSAQLKLTGLLKDNGAKILAGSDLGGIWVLPGVGLHQEFRELAAAGLSPLQVLQATTLNGAQFLKRESSMGTVEQGKNADLVLLEANPLASVENLSKIAAVFVQGQHVSSSSIENLKRDIAQLYREQPQMSASSVLDPNHVH